MQRERSTLIFASIHFPTVPFKRFLHLNYSYFSNLFLDGWIFGKMFEHRVQYYIALPYYLESFSWKFGRNCIDSFTSVTD